MSSLFCRPFDTHRRVIRDTLCQKISTHPTRGASGPTDPMICRGLETSKVRTSYRKISEVALMPLPRLPYWLCPLTEKPVLPPVHLFLASLNRGVFQHLHPPPVSGRDAPPTLDPNIGRRPCPGSGSQGPSVSPTMIVSDFSVQVTSSSLSLPPRRAPFRPISAISLLPRRANRRWPSSMTGCRPCR